MQLSPSSEKKLEGVDSRLAAVVHHAAEITNVWFIVTEGLRTVERQKQLVAEGKSKTMNSYHIKGKAVDLAIWVDKDSDKVVDADELSWKFEEYKKLADVMKKAAIEVGVKITWGGDWTSFKDGPHFQLED